MSDSDKNLRIKITTTADLTGANAAAKGLKQLNAEAAKQAQQSGTLSDKTKKFIKRLDEQGKSAGKLNLSHRETIMLTHQLVQGMPELGHIIAELANPYIGLTLAVGATIGKFMEIRQQMISLQNTPGPDWQVQTTELAELQKVYDEAANSLAVFEREMEKAAQKPQGPADVATRRIEDLKRAQSAEAEYLGARQKLDESSVDEMEERGLISHEDALNRKFQLDQDYEKKKEALEEKRAQAEIFAKQREAAEAALKLHVSKENIPGAAQAAADADTAVKRNDQQRTRNQTDLDTAIAFRKTLQDGMAEAQLVINNADLSPADRWARPEARKTLADLDAQNAANESAIAALRGKVAGANTAEPGLKDAADARKEELETLKGTSKEMTEEIHKLGLEIPVLQARAGEDAANKREIGAMGTFESAKKLPLGGGYTGADVGQASILMRQKALFDSHAAGVAALTAAQQKFLEGYESYAHITPAAWDKGFQLHLEIAGALTTYVRKTEALTAEVAAIRQLHHLPQTNVATALGSGY